VIDKEIRCAHPDCGRGFHTHQPRNAPPVSSHPLPPRAKPRAELDTIPGNRRSLTPSARAASAKERGGALPGERRRCRICNEEKDGTEFYASSGCVCKGCFNNRASERTKAERKASRRLTMARRR
jgi:hypothetical protein